MSTKRKDTSVDVEERDYKPQKKKSKSANGKKQSMIRAELNTLYESKLKDQLREAFLNKKNYHTSEGTTKNTSTGSEGPSEYSISDDAAKVHCDPFTCCVLPNFIKDEAFLEGLKDELLNLDFCDKSNDLYKFQQSDALQNISSPYISGLRTFLYQDFLGWLRDVTDIEFNDTIDMTCSKYTYTDVLLCHDDELEGRRIAFILYLVPPWSEQDGGLLDLFESDEHYRPKKISKSLVPKWNSFVFFEVTPASFHQVSEVLTQDKLRLSVSGWFHGASVARPEPFIEPSAPICGYVPLEEGLFVRWMNPCYLDPDSHAQISRTFNEESQIQLPSFFNEDRFKALLGVLHDEGIKWTLRGPPDRRCYEVAEKSSYPSTLKECLQVVQSELMFLLLSRLTGLKFHEDAEDTSSDEEDEDETKQIHAGSASRRPGCRLEVRRWRHGDYTLIHDIDTVESEFSLDFNLFIGCDGWENDMGGFMSYIARGEDEELLSVEPQDNTLALVYKDTDTLSFTKHINHRFSKPAGSRESAFFTIAMVFYE